MTVDEMWERVRQEESRDQAHGIMHVGISNQIHGLKEIITKKKEEAKASLFIITNP